MDYLQDIRRALLFIEQNLENKLRVEDVSNHVFSSNVHFQRVFNLVTGYTIGEYIRNRRLSMAGLALQHTDTKVIDIALQYQYETPESFSKAFYRFHGVHPSNVRSDGVRLKQFSPLQIHLTIEGGYDMTQQQTEEFCWSTLQEQNGEGVSDREKYRAISAWALQARCQNPTVFDALTDWLLDDSEWSREKLGQNEQILMHSVIERFKEQNKKLRADLLKLATSGVVNKAVFKKLDEFDAELSGRCEDAALKDAVSKLFGDFSVMLDRKTRELIAGNKTGPTGTDSVPLFGYINRLKEADAGVQWTLFMPDEVERKQVGFRLESFEYKTLPAFRFVGFEGEEYSDVEKRMSKMKVLDSLSDYASGFDVDLLLMHFYGVGVDVGQWHGAFGRFMKADTPVPEGFLSIDFVPNFTGKAGPPYISQFAYATFSGGQDALHCQEGFDGDAMYDTTRNIILGQGGDIPYPDKYWTAEAFLDGCDKGGTGYLFSAKL